MADTRNGYTYGYERVAPGAGMPSEESHKVEPEQLWRQYIVGAVVNMAVLCTGYSMGWTAPINTKLTSNDTAQSPLGQTATSEELAWMGSLLNIGIIIGPFIGGFAASTIGRKWGLMSSTVPLFFGWILAAAATNMTYLYAARLCWGIGTSILFTICPMYCAEIATTECRGAIGSFIQTFMSAGFLLVYAAGPSISYHAVTYLGMAMLALFVGCFFFMPESPTYCLIKGKSESASQSLMMLRGRSRQGVAAELALIEVDVAIFMQKTARFRDVFRGGNFKAFYISCGLMFFQQFSGINAVLFYMPDIFKASGTDVDPFIATIVVGTVQLASSFISPLVVDRLGRRFLLLTSSAGTAVALAFLGTFFLLSHLESSAVEMIKFLPVVVMVIFMAMFCLGLGSLPWAMLGELLPIEVNTAVAPVVTALSGFLSFFVTKFFPSISNAIGMHVSFFIFSGFCVASFLFALLVVPETKGKSFQEIRAMLDSSAIHKHMNSNPRQKICSANTT